MKTLQNPVEQFVQQPRKQHRCNPRRCRHNPITSLYNSVNPADKPPRAGYPSPKKVNLVIIVGLYKPQTVKGYLLSLLDPALKTPSALLKGSWQPSPRGRPGRA